MNTVRRSVYIPINVLEYHQKRGVNISGLCRELLTEMMVMLERKGTGVDAPKEQPPEDGPPCDRPSIPTLDGGPPRDRLSRKEMEGRIWERQEGYYEKANHYSTSDDPFDWMRCATCVFYSPMGHEVTTYADYCGEDVAEDWVPEHLMFPFSGALCRAFGHGVDYAHSDIGCRAGCWRPARWLPDMVLEKVVEALEENDQHVRSGGVDKRKLTKERREALCVKYGVSVVSSDAVRRSVSKSIYVRTYHKNWLNKQCFKLSKYMQRHIDELMVTGKVPVIVENPESDPSVASAQSVLITVVLRKDQADWVKEKEINFPKYVRALLDHLMSQEER